MIENGKDFKKDGSQAGTSDVQATKLKDENLSKEQLLQLVKSNSVQAANAMGGEGTCHQKEQKNREQFLKHIERKRYPRAVGQWPSTLTVSRAEVPRSDEFIRSGSSR